MQKLWARAHTTLSQRVILLYCTLLLFACVYFSFLLVSADRTRQQAMIERTHTAMLEQLVTWTDSLLGDRVDSLVAEQLLSLQRGQSLHSFLYQTGGTQSMAAYQLHRQMQNIVSSNEFIESIWVYAGRSGALLSSTQGVYLEYSREGIYDRYIDRAAIDALAGTVQPPRWLPINPSRINGNRDTPVSFVRTIPAGTTHGLLIIPVDLHGCVTRMLHQNSSGGTVYVYNRDGTLLASGSSRDAATAKAPDIAALETDAGYARADGIVMSWMTDRQNTLRYVFVVPDASYSEFNIDPNILLLIAMGLLLAMVVGIFGGVRLFRSLNALISRARSNVSLEGIRSEETVIRALLENLSQQNTDMLQMQQRYSRVSAHKLIDDLIDGRIDTAQQLRGLLATNHGIRDLPAMAFVTISFAQRMFDKLDLQYRHALRLTLEEDFLQFVAATRHDAVLAGSSQGADLAALVIAPDTDGWTDWLTPFCTDMHRKHQIALTIAYADPQTEPRRLSDAYEACLGAMRYRFFTGEGHVFGAASVAASERTPYPAMLSESEIVALLRQNQVDPIRDAVIRMQQAAQDGAYSYDSVQQAITLVIHCIARESQQLSAPISPLDRGALRESFIDMDTLPDAATFVLDLLTHYQSAKTDAQERLHSSFIEQIRAWIDANIGRQITLQSTADAFHISTGHLSRIFKASFGISFSDYVIERKFEHACHLLADTDLPIAAIVEQLGYANASYFSRLFRAKYGITPSQYRKKQYIGHP